MQTKHKTTPPKPVLGDKDKRQKCLNQEAISQKAAICKVANEFDDLLSDVEEDGHENALTELLAQFDNHTNHVTIEQGAFPQQFNEARVHKACDAEEDSQLSQAIEQMLKDYDKSPRKDQSKPGHNSFRRFKVADVLLESFKDCKNIKLIEEVGSMDQCASSGDSMILLQLHGEWLLTPIEKDQIIHVAGGVFDAYNNSIIIDNQNGFVIINPDNLISTTVVADSFNCVRKAIISDRVRAPFDKTPALVYGNMLHEIFQECLVQNDFSDKRLDKGIGRALKEHIQDLLIIDQTENDAREHLRQIVLRFKEFSQNYILPRPKAESVISVHRGDGGTNSAAVSKVLDIEENIWSPAFGLKGKIDASVQITSESAERSERVTVAPFELKTGRSTKNLSHRAQTTLYNLLLSERYGLDIEFGLLYYCVNNEIIKVPKLHDELRSLIVARNEVSWYMQTKNSLPPMLRNNHVCSRCYSRDSCFIYHKAFENGTKDSAGVGDLFEEKTGHLNERQKEFFQNWDRLLYLEEGSLMRFRKEIWTMTSKERSNIGRCYPKMLIGNFIGVVTESRIGKYRYEMVSAESTEIASASDISPGDAIVVSSETGAYALAIGYIIEVKPQSLVIGIDRKLCGPPLRSQNYEALNNQNHYSRFAAHQSNELRPKQQNDVYRIDKDEWMSGFGSVRYSLVNLMTVDGDVERRRLIVDLEAPRFRENLEYYHDLPNWSQVNEHINSDSMNSDQKTAIRKILLAKDYALILGMPGTGKTTTIVELVKSLWLLGKSVLITSYTHTAVDNILLKLQSAGIEFLRLGSKDKIMTRLHDAVFDPANFQDVASLKSICNSVRVIATTCLGINHPILNGRSFDYCIVDEASQITLPVCLGPLRFCKTFVLVGDHNQLPPVVQNQEARDKGLSCSLFKLLSDAHPLAVASLCTQYRMNFEIMSISNLLIYNGALRCGSDLVAHSRLPLGGFDEMKENLPKFLLQVLDPAFPVIFLDTDQAEFPEVRIGDLIQNPGEAKLAANVARRFVEAGLDPWEIGVVAPYRAQLKLIEKQLGKFKGQMEINTVDKFQGRDKECIIISFVRSNKSLQIGDLLKDWRRLNVALTRSKHKLILIGSKATLSSVPLYSRMLDVLVDRNAIISVPSGQAEKSKNAALHDTPVKMIADTEHLTKKILAENPTLANIVTE